MAANKLKISALHKMSYFFIIDVEFSGHILDGEAPVRIFREQSPYIPVKPLFVVAAARAYMFGPSLDHHGLAAYTALDQIQRHKTITALI
jgi:hypothetical protein